MGSVIKKRRKRMSKKKHRKMLRRTRVQRRKLGKKPQPASCPPPLCGGFLHACRCPPSARYRPRYRR